MTLPDESCQSFNTLATTRNGYDPACWPITGLAQLSVSYRRFILISESMIASILVVSQCVCEADSSSTQWEDKHHHDHVCNCNDTGSSKAKRRICDNKSTNVGMYRMKLTLLNMRKVSNLAEKRRLANRMYVKKRNEVDYCEKGVYAVLSR